MRQTPAVARAAGGYNSIPKQRTQKNMYQGTVKFFSTRGFGFLKRDDGLDEIYFHKTRIAGGVTLFEGDRVAFDTEISNRSGKIQAVNLRLV
jgi:cold shock CspA family protein